jgi:hypothetical protein
MRISCEATVVADSSIAVGGERPGDGMLINGWSLSEELLTDCGSETPVTWPRCHGRGEGEDIIFPC